MMYRVHMKIFLYCILLLGALVFVSQGCSRADLYDRASRDVNLIYAVSGDASTYSSLLVSDGGDFLDEFSMTVWPVATPPTALYVDQDDSRIFAAQGTTVYYSTDRDPSREWKSQAIGSTVMGFARYQGSTVLLTSTLTDCIYRYDESLQTWSTQSKQVAESPQKLFYDRTTGATLLMTEGASTGYIYAVNTMPTGSTATAAASYSGYTIGTTRFFGRLGLYFYAGNAAYLYKGSASTFSQVNATSLSSAASYAVTSSGDWFAVCTSPNLSIYRFDGTNFIQKQVLTSTVGSAVMAVVDDDTLAVGIAGAGVSSENGLYAYSISGNTLRQISAKPVYALFVR